MNLGQFPLWSREEVRPYDCSGISGNLPQSLCPHHSWSGEEAVSFCRLKRKQVIRAAMAASCPLWTLCRNSLSPVSLSVPTGHCSPDLPVTLKRAASWLPLLCLPPCFLHFSAHVHTAPSVPKQRLCQRQPDPKKRRKQGYAPALGNFCPGRVISDEHPVYTSLRPGDISHAVFPHAWTRLLWTEPLDLRVEILCSFSLGSLTPEDPE